MRMKEILLTPKRAWHRWVEELINGPLWQFISPATAIQKGWEAALVKVFSDSEEPKIIRRKAWRISKLG